MSLAILVSQDKWQEFDTAWSELMTAEGPIDDLLNALRLAGDKKRMPRCLPLLKEHTGLLAAGERHQDAARLIGAALKGGAAGTTLYESLYESALKAWGQEVWWDSFTEMTQLAPDSSDIRRAWVAFERLCSFQPGSLVYHPGGWGTGEVLELRHQTSEMVVRFGNGRQDTFPLAAGIDIFRELSEDDLRAQYFRDPAAMKKRLKAEPLEVLKAVVGRHNGRATLISIRNALMQVGVEGSGWTAWWRKARKEAMGSEWFRVTGNAQRGEVQLLLSASDPVADMRRRLGHSSSLGEVCLRVRELISGAAGKGELRKVALEILIERAADTEAEPQATDHEHFEAWVILRAESAESPPEMLALLPELAAREAPSDPAVAPDLWALFQSLSAARDQERCLEILREVFPEDAWQQEAVRHLQHAPAGMVKPLMESLLEAGHADALLDHYNELLLRPMRSPHVLVALTRAIENGAVSRAASEAKLAALPTPAQRAQALLGLASYLELNRRGSILLNRVHTRLVDILTKGERALLPRLLEGADATAVMSVRQLVQRGVDEAIDNMVTDIAVAHGVEAGEDRVPYFWENDRVWTTRAGLDQRRAQLRELQDVKIPENTEAIGRAAAMGDLSENAEWEAAIEEQRNLTERASQIEKELRLADVIEGATMPENTVCPGAAVRYRELASGEEHRIQILGPWDTDRADDVVSYRAPLAAGLLGLHPGESVRIQLPRGEVQLEVLDIEVTLPT